MNRLNLMNLFIVALLTACATTQHTVDQDRLASVKDQMFHVRSVKIDCYGISAISSRVPWHGVCGKDCQLGLLNNIPIEDIVMKLSESYGIKIAKEEMTIESSITNLLMAVASDSAAGRCFFKQGSTPSDNANSIDIEYTVSPSNFPARVTVGYEVTVLSSTNLLIKHQDEIGTFDYNYSKWNFSDELMKNIRDGAVKISSALERDIKTYPSLSKP